MGSARGVAKPSPRAESAARAEPSPRTEAVARPAVAAPRAAAPVARPAPAPVVMPMPGGGGESARPSRSNEPRADGPGVWAGLQRTFTVNLGGVLLAVAGVVGLMFIIWSLAWRRGYTYADAKAVRELGNPAVQDPLKQPAIRVNPDLLGRDQGRAEAAKPASKPAPAPSAGGSAGAGTQPTPPAPGTDPRQAGVNYLTLASQLDKETATAAAAFLTQNGCPAFAIAVDRSGRAVKNGSQFAVYAARGFAGDEFRAKKAEREALEEQVRRLGKVWQKEHRGGTDFSQTFWQKHAP